MSPTDAVLGGQIAAGTPNELDRMKDDARARCGRVRSTVQIPP